jgi:glycosyltransferase involved in cell wall biosynthesis
MSIGIYDHALHVIGGGQKYVATMASALQDRFDVTYLVNKDVDLGRVAAWYGLDLSRCKLRLVEIPFFARREWIDSSRVDYGMENPFDAVARASADYDVFVNANMLEKVRPRAPISVFVCHFPDLLARAHFAVDQYTIVVANSRYTSEWIRKRWGLLATLLLYPPVDAPGPAVPKERIILSVARFEPSGSKKQIELVNAFRALRKAFPDDLAGWRLVLAGGSLERNPYLRAVRSSAGSDRDGIEVRVNIPLDELLRWYARSSIFWHACGLCETDPQLVEHFGMTTVEAMQNGCAAVVIDGGGQREIVEHGASGFRFRTLDELCLHTLRLVRDGGLRESIQRGARERARRFGRGVFEERVLALFDLIEREYRNVGPSEGAEAREAD